jgi:uncharacterized membrane protein
MVKWRKRERRCGPWAVAVSARTVRIGVSRMGGRILQALDAIVLLTELVLCLSAARLNAVQVSG